MGRALALNPSFDDTVEDVRNALMIRLGLITNPSWVSDLYTMYLTWRNDHKRRDDKRRLRNSVNRLSRPGIARSVSLSRCIVDWERYLWSWDMVRTVESCWGRQGYTVADIMGLHQIGLGAIEISETGLDRNEKTISLIHLFPEHHTHVFPLTPRAGASRKRTSPRDSASKQPFHTFFIELAVLENAETLASCYICDSA
jgi:hypothetical protein